jgi:hypothetical protein
MPLNVQVYRINNDLAELFFNPREVDLRVGEVKTAVPAGNSGMAGFRVGMWMF